MELCATFEPAIMAQAFPERMRGPVLSAAELACRAGLHEYQSGQFAVQVEGEGLLIPERLYFRGFRPTSLPDAESRLIGWCLFSRSDNGFERQAALREIVRANRSWTIPFVVALIGEYVIEILDDIEAALPDMDEAVVARFVAENPAYMALTEARVASYWNVYYRHRSTRRGYVGSRLIAALRDIERKHRDAPHGDAS